MAKDVTELAKDVKKFIQQKREEAGPVIIRSLQSEGPWWTSSFGTKWQLSQNPVKPTDDRPGFDRDVNEGIPDPTSTPKPKPTDLVTVSSLRFPIERPMYIGNSASYAGFAVNNPSATVPRRDGTPVTYEKHGEKYKLTAKDQNPNWYNVYTKSGGLFADLDKVFRAM